MIQNPVLRRIAGVIWAAIAVWDHRLVPSSDLVRADPRESPDHARDPLGRSGDSRDGLARLAVFSGEWAAREHF